MDDDSSAPQWLGGYDLRWRIGSAAGHHRPDGHRLRRRKEPANAIYPRPQADQDRPSRNSHSRCPDGARHGIGGGTFSDDLIAYHLERARGGVGLTILEILSVHPTSLGTLNSFDPTLVDSYRKFMEQVRPTGMRVFQQIWHAGHNGTNASGGPPWSASEMPSPTVGVVPVAMTTAMIQEIVQTFAATARKCEEGGLDRVEIHCAHGYLVHQFLSPSLNRRGDESIEVLRRTGSASCWKSSARSARPFRRGSR